MLIIASIQKLKRGNKKCGKDEVFRLFRDSADDANEKNFWQIIGIDNSKPICQTKYYWKLRMLIAAKGKPKSQRKWWKPRKTCFNGRYWKPQTINLARIQEYKKFLFDRS